MGGLQETEDAYKGVNWIHLAQEKDQWWYLLNTVISLVIL